MDIREKLQEYKDDAISQPYEYTSSAEQEIIEYVDGLEDHIKELESENVILNDIVNGRR